MHQSSFVVFPTTRSFFLFHNHDGVLSVFRLYSYPQSCFVHDGGCDFLSSISSIGRPKKDGGVSIMRMVVLNASIDCEKT